jgi:hypothetical protein
VAAAATADVNVVEVSSSAANTADGINIRAMTAAIVDRRMGLSPETFRRVDAPTPMKRAIAVPLAWHGANY